MDCCCCCCRRRRAARCLGAIVAPSSSRRPAVVVNCFDGGALRGFFLEGNDVVVLVLAALLTVSCRAKASCAAMVTAKESVARCAAARRGRGSLGVVSPVASLSCFESTTNPSSSLLLFLRFRAAFAFVVDLLLLIFLLDGLLGFFLSAVAAANVTRMQS